MLFLERPRSPVNNFPDAMVSLFLWRTQKFSASLERDEFPGPDVTPGPLAKYYSESPLEIHLEGVISATQVPINVRKGSHKLE